MAEPGGKPGYAVRANFTTGEIDPTVVPQLDLEQRNAALKSCENWIPNFFGGIETRPGTKFVGLVRRFPPSAQFPLVNSLHFDNTTSAFIQLSNGLADHFRIQNEFTIEAWCMPDVVDPRHPIMGKWKDFPLFYDQRSYFMQINTAVVAPAGHIDLQISTTGANFPLSRTPGGITQLFQWQHVAGSFDGSTMKIYFNGDLKVTTPFLSPGLFDAVGEELYLGRSDSAGATRNFGGFLSDLRLWGNAVSQSDIQAAMNNRLTGNETNLLGYWPLWEGEGTFITDVSGFGIHGTAQPGCSWMAQAPPPGLG